MKKTTRMKALMLSLAMTAMLLPMTSFAQQTSDDFFRVDDAFNDNRAVAIALTGNLANDDFGAPLGSGLLILTAAGAGYAISRRKRSFRKGSALVLAALMLLGMTACKKKIAEPIIPATGNQVAITLNVGGGAKAEVDPPHVTFETGDQILVASNGHYVGTLTHNGTNFSGSITGPEVGQPLYFYFLGNKDTGTLTPGASGSTSCTVIISDQTNYPHLPVISMGVSIDREHGNAIVNYSAGVDTYEAQLHNKASLIKFNVTTLSTAPICITGMNNKVMVDFSKAANDGQNNGFTYDKEGEGIIKMKGVASSGAATWAIVLQQDALDKGGEGTAYTTDFSYVGARAAVPAITMDQYLNEDRPMTVSTHVWNGNLAALNGSEPEGFATARDGMTIYGTLAAKVKVSIASGATVTLSDATIIGTDDNSYPWAGLNCLGDATIILKDGSTNNVRGFYEDYPGIHVPKDKTLTIKGETLGTGSLNASSNTDATASGAGIGGGWNIACGNIVIQSGVITATGSMSAAGIGCTNQNCGDITISGGTVTATGGENAAGIGSGSGTCGNITISGGTVTSTGGMSGAGIGSGKDGGHCGNITIATTVTSVTATKGSGSPCSIGHGYNSYCGTVTIGGVVGAISESPYTYPVPTGAINGKFTINASGDKVYFSQGNLQATTENKGYNWSWAFAEHQWDYVGGRSSGGSEAQTGNNFINGDGIVSTNGTVDLFGWSTAATYYGIHNSEDNKDYSGSFQDWGSNAITNGGNTANCGWYTLSMDEWGYLINTRAGATVDATANARYTLATINTDGTGVNGMILFPDNGSFAAGEATTWETFNAPSAWTTKCTTAQWEALETKGCVFLPAAGGRMGTNCNSQGTAASYYTSTNYGTEHAFRLAFSNSSITIEGDQKGRLDGRSVRLVRNAN